MKRAIKKAIITAVVFTFVLMLVAGCNSGNGGEGGSGGGGGGAGGADGANGWPTADLPPGFPVYPNGDVTDVGGKVDDGMGILIEVSYTDEDAYNSYQKTLADGGWEGTEVRLIKGSLLLGLAYYDAGNDAGVVHLLLKDLDAEEE